MAVPASNLDMIAVVDKLTMMFPTIERPVIQNIAVNECKGDTTKAIIVLTRIQQFNQSMNAAKNNTSSGGEALPAQQVVQVSPSGIPLSINQPLPVSGVSAGNQCCDCGGQNTSSNDCCYCCLLKPASYKKGLYRIDYAMYSYAFLAFSLFTIYPESKLYTLSFGYQGLYLPTVGLVLLFMASTFIFCDKNGINSTMQFIRACLFIFGGLIYFLGYIIHAISVQTICDLDSEWWWDESDCESGFYYWFNDITPEWPYLIARGLFVGFHAIFIGLLYVANHKLKIFHNRLNLIRIWSLLFFLFSIGLCFLLNGYIFLLFTCGAPVLCCLISFLNIFVIRQQDERGGCNCSAVLALTLSISYYICTFVFAIFIIILSFQHDAQLGLYLLWDLSMLMFGAMQLWILSRAMHPVAANCGCVMDGSGDGNINVAYPVIQPQVVQQPQQQVMMVIQQPQTIGMVPAVPVVSALGPAPVQDIKTLKINADNKEDNDDMDDNDDNVDIDLVAQADDNNTNKSKGDNDNDNNDIEINDGVDNFED